MLINPICIYRGQSVEGFSCAWTVWRKFKDSFEFIPVSYSDPIPNCKGRDVIIVDFTYNTDTILCILNESNSLTLIDNKPTSYDVIKNHKILGVVDCNKSACILTWEYFHNTAAPVFMNYIQNREFWKFDLPYSKEVCLAISNRNLSFENYDDLYEDYIDDLIIEGLAISRKFDNDIENIIKDKKILYFSNFKIQTVASPYFYTTECANILSEKYEIGAAFYYINNKFHFSLRSRIDSDVDVSEIAKYYGGNGSKHSAGFVVSLDFDPVQQVLDSSKKFG